MDGLGNAAGSFESSRGLPEHSEVILTAGLRVALSVFTVKEIREAMAMKVREFGWSDGAWGKKDSPACCG